MRYEVIIPWFGVNKGDVVETEKLHPSLLSNVRALEESKVELVVATPKTEEVEEPKKRGRKPKEV